MPHALLLSPDDQAVSAISGVLEEMSVTCERPLDGVSAAQKLNSEAFDLVLVDCENLPAAKLIFDVCRRGKGGNNPVPIAIVDGRAGLPTAFRLGAELILTKPVAKDQARSTIRAAVGRLRKDVPANESTASQPANAAATTASQSTAFLTEERAQAAAASSQSATFAEAGPRFARGEVPPSYLTAALTASGFSTDLKATKTSAVADELETDIPSKSNSSSTSSLSSPSSPSSEYESYRDDSSSHDEASNHEDSMHAPTSQFPKPDNDLVLTEIDRVEREQLASAQSNPPRLALAKSAGASGRPYQRGPRQTHGPLVALLMLTVAGGAFYGAWMYQPGFREIAKPQVDRLLNLAAKGLPPASKPSPAKPSAHVAAAPTAAPVLQPTTLPDSPAQTTTSSTTPSPDPATSSASSSATSSATNSATGSVSASATPAPAPTEAPAPASKPATTSASANVSVPPTVAPSVAIVPPAPAVKDAPPAVIKAETVKPSSQPNENKESKKDAAAAPPADAPLPGENTALVLSSKGAEKRLAHSVPPKFPADASKSSAPGTVVLKTVVDENGDVAGVRLVNGNAVLAPAAIQAVKQWHYRPYVRDGKALPFQTVVIIDFQRP
jgi:TonB family protein